MEELDVILNILKIFKDGLEEDSIKTETLEDLGLSKVKLYNILDLMQQDGLIRKKGDIFLKNKGKPIGLKLSGTKITYAGLNLLARKTEGLMDKAIMDNIEKKISDINFGEVKIVVHQGKVTFVESTKKEKIE